MGGTVFFPFARSVNPLWGMGGFLSEDEREIAVTGPILLYIIIFFYL